MTSITSQLVIDESNLIEFDIFINKDPDSTNIAKALGELEASEACLLTALSFSEWRGYQYDKSTKIGYGTTLDLDGNGLSEQESYSYWIANWKDAERKFKRQCPVPVLSQSQYDALAHLYFHTGDALNVGSGSRRLYIGDWMKEGKWNYIATALTYTSDNANMRQREAAIMMLADYGQPFTREELREQGLQRMRKRYPKLMDVKQQRQSEYVYFVETERFLPNMSQSRMRQIKKLTENK